MSNGTFGSEKHSIWNVKWNTTINSWLDNIEEKISELEDTEMETTQIEGEINKALKKWIETLWPVEQLKKLNIYVIGIPVKGGATYIMEILIIRTLEWLY